MKIYSNAFDLATPVERKVFVAPNSIYAFGIKIVKNDVPVEDGALKVYEDGVELVPMETTIDGFALFQKTSASVASSSKVDVVYMKSGNEQHFDLTLVTTDSTVFDVDQSSGAFELPIASETVLGGIKVGENLTIDADGTLNAEAGGEEYTAGNGIGIDDHVISLTATIPTKVSELQNDKNYAELSAVPTKTSDLTNDSNFATVSQIPTKTSDLTNDSGFITNADIPTKTSDLTNDSGFITSSDVPTKTSDLINDSGFITEVPSDIEVDNLIAVETAELKGTVTIDKENFLDINSGEKAIPEAVSELDNDSGFITASDVSGNVPVATTTTAGKVIVGSGLSVDANGKIDVTGGGGGSETDPVFTAWSEGEQIAAGFGSSASGIDAVAYGKYTAATGDGSIAIGNAAEANGANSVAVGYDAYVSGANAVQLGQGVNETNGSLQFNSYPLVDNAGHIPEARLSANALVKSTPTAVLSGTYSDDTEFSFEVYIKQ